MEGTGTYLPRSSGSLRRYSHRTSPVVASSAWSVRVAEAERASEHGPHAERSLQASKNDGLKADAERQSERSRRGECLTVEWGAEIRVVVPVCPQHRRLRERIEPRHGCAVGWAQD